MSEPLLHPNRIKAELVEYDGELRSYVIRELDAWSAALDPISPGIEIVLEENEDGSGTSVYLDLKSLLKSLKATGTIK